jgi:hypothetical protein
MNTSIKDKYFSVVIPTMWRSDFISKMLPVYESCSKVKEIIIIDNDPEKKLDLEKFKKVIYYTENENLFVNPSWNKGYELSSYELILANDDIYIPNLDDVLELITTSDYDIIGLSWVETNELKIDKIEEFKGGGFGCFMYVKNFIEIPNEYKIWRGDFIQFENNKKRGVLINPMLEGEISKTILSDDKFLDIAKTDRITYKGNQNDKSNKSITIPE